MKTAKLIGKIIIALAAVAGVVYVVATYGDRMVAWARKTLTRYNKCDECDCDCDDCDCDCDCTCFDTFSDVEPAVQNDFEG